MIRTEALDAPLYDVAERELAPVARVVVPTISIALGPVPAVVTVVMAVTVPAVVTPIAEVGPLTAEVVAEVVRVLCSSGSSRIVRLRRFRNGLGGRCVLGSLVTLVVVHASIITQRAGGGICNASMPRRA